MTGGFAADSAAEGNVSGGSSAVPLRRPSPEGVEALNRLRRFLEEPLNFEASTGRSNGGGGEHLELLKEVWVGFFGAAGGPFVLRSPLWRSRAGFTRNDVAPDMDKVGTLALRALAYMATTYERKTRAMLEAQRANTAETYPFAFLGVNLTKMLAEVLKLKSTSTTNSGGGDFAQLEAAWWGVFENDIEDAAFFELFSLAFGHIDYLWRERRANRKQFAPLMRDTKKAIEDLLQTGPASPEQLLQRAANMGLVHNN